MKLECLIQRASGTGIREVITMLDYEELAYKILIAKKESKKAVNNFASDIVELKSNVSDVGTMFKGSTFLEKINLPNVTNLDNDAFRSCSNLEEVILPEAQTIGDYAFCENTKLNAITAPKLKSGGYASLFKCNSLASVNFPELEHVGSGMFYENLNLITVVAPKITQIDDFAFNGSGITSMNLPLVKKLPKQAFYNCQSLTSMNLPEVEEIGRFAIGAGKNRSIPITSLIAPKVKKLGISALQNCNLLESVDFPILEEIDQLSLSGMTAIKEARFPNLMKLADASMQKMVSLEIAEMRVSDISAETFLNDSKMAILILRTESLCTLTNINAFSNTPFASGKAGGTLYVPQALISAYQSATNWNTILGYPNNKILPIEGSEYDESSN